MRNNASKKLKAFVEYRNKTLVSSRITVAEESQGRTPRDSNVQTKVHVRRELVTTAGTALGLEALDSLMSVSIMSRTALALSSVVAVEGRPSRRSSVSLVRPNWN
ncbi:hypothetical protein EVAR_49932_1 [Eumeta japonica]|uniref:Uncharacterized protein n=1 Tax=Eumeta variegata TaxID=151549 RepID=A0A4C1XXI6_EUMVA|nr:hypothetical protein EVAR_49932_1 [Eumeta japonica]